MNGVGAWVKFRLGPGCGGRFSRPGGGLCFTSWIRFSRSSIFSKFSGAHPPPALPPNIMRFFQKFKGVVLREAGVARRPSGGFMGYWLRAVASRVRVVWVDGLLSTSYG